MTLTTTLNEIRKHYPCQDGWRRLLASLGKTEADDEPLPMVHILESNGVDDFLWCLRVLPGEYENAIRILACDIAERALRFVPVGEDRPRHAIEVARRYARGEATDDELKTAGNSAENAARECELRAFEAAEAAWSAVMAADASVRKRAWVGAEAAWTAAFDSEGHPALAAEREAQAEICRKWLAQFDGETE